MHGWSGNLPRILNIILYNQNPDLPVISFNIRNMDNDEVGYILAKAYGIITRTGLHCAPLVHQRIDGGKGCVRISFSHLNTPDECLYAVKAVREVAARCESLSPSRQSSALTGRS